MIAVGSTTLAISALLKLTPARWVDENAFLSKVINENTDYSKNGVIKAWKKTAEVDVVSGVIARASDYKKKKDEKKEEPKYVDEDDVDNDFPKV